MSVSNTVITLLTANNTINDMRLKVNELALNIMEYQNANTFVFANTEIIGNLSVTDDILLQGNSLNEHLANNYAHGVVVQDVVFNANTGVLTLTYNDVHNTSIDLNIGAQDNVHFDLVTSNNIVSRVIEVIDTLYAYSNVDITGILNASDEIKASSNVSIAGSLNLAGNFNASANISVSGITTANSLNVLDDLSVTGDFNSPSSTFNILTSPSTINLGAGSGNVYIGSLSGNTHARNDLRVAGDVYISGQDLNTTTSIFNLLNTTATNINFGGAATTIFIGATTGNTSIRNNASIAGTLYATGNTSILGTLFLNSGTLDSTAADVSLFNNATNVTIGNTSSTLLLGGSAGVVTIAGDSILEKTLQVDGYATFWSNVAINSDELTSDQNIFSLFPSTSYLTIGANTGLTVIRNSTRFNDTIDVLNDVTISGNLTISGANTTIDTVNLNIRDKNLHINSIDAPTDITADGGGIILRGLTDKTILWNLSDLNWTSSESWNLVPGKVYKIANVEVLSSNTLGSVITDSSLTKVGIIATGVWNATPITTDKGGTNLTSYNTGDIIYASAANTLAVLPIGSLDQILQVGSDGVPYWTSVIDGGTY